MFSLQFWFFQLIIGMFLFPSCNEEKRNKRNRPSDDGENIPEYLREDRTTILKGSTGLVMSAMRASRFLQEHWETMQS